MTVRVALQRRYWFVLLPSRIAIFSVLVGLNTPTDIGMLRLGTVVSMVWTDTDTGGAVVGVVLRFGGKAAASAKK